jgi:hypothetical protein
VDDSGEISIQNLKNLFGDSFLNVPIEDLIKEADADGNELISFDEFKVFVAKCGEDGGNFGEVESPIRNDQSYQLGPLEDLKPGGGQNGVTQNGKNSPHRLNAPSG